MKKIPGAAALIILILIAALTFIAVKIFRTPGRLTLLQSQGMDMAKMAAPAGAVPVAVKNVSPQSLSEKISYSGSAVAFNRQMAASRVSGYLKEILVYPGDRVAPGQLLAVISAPELSGQLGEAESQSRAAAKARAASEEDKSGARYRLSAAQADLTYWQAEIEREKNLFKAGAVSRDEYQQELASYEKSKFNLQAAASELKAQQARLEESSAMAEKENFARQTAGVFQDFTNLRSELAGRVSKRMINQGSMVSPGDAILQIDQTDPIRLQASVAGQDLPGIKVGNPVTVYDLNRKKSVSSTISAIFPSADPATRTFTIEAVTPNPDLRFLPDEYITMEIAKAQVENALAVPNSALVEIAGKTAVWLAKNQKAHLVYVETGISDGENTRILSGISSGDQVIYAGIQDLTEGSAVYPTAWGASGAEKLPPPPQMENMPGMQRH